MKSKIGISIAIGALAGTAAFASADASAGRELILSAPIQKIDHGADTVTVLGMTFHTSTAQLSVGEVVNVYGELAKDGSVADSVVQGTNTYGANGDPVFLKGRVTDSDPALGHLQVDGMTVDYTSQLSNPNFATPNVGDIVAVSGVQPVAQGVLMANATGDAAYASSAIGGAATFSQAAGLAKAQITGGGTDAAQITGGGTAQITGGGLADAQITGGGFASAQITGGGVRSAQITGGGFAGAQITGGGFAASQITGGGFAAAQITGGGVAAAQITGGGVHAAQITGGGK